MLHRIVFDFGTVINMYSWSHYICCTRIKIFNLILKIPIQYCLAYIGDVAGWKLMIANSTGYALNVRVVYLDIDNNNNNNIYMDMVLVEHHLKV